MAPREATGNFPDQFLLMDVYESPVLHEIVLPEDDTQLMMTEADALNATNTVAVDDIEVLTQEQNHSHNNNNNINHHHSSQNVPLDPLSIDPTEHTSNDTDTTASSVHRALLSIRSTPGVTPAVTTTTTATAAVVVSAASSPTAATATSESNHHSSSSNSSSASSHSGPLSTGSSVLRRASPATSPSSFHVLRRSVLRSMLDFEEEDDEDDNPNSSENHTLPTSEEEPLPDLDRTWNSTTTSPVNGVDETNRSTTEQQQQEDDDDDDEDMDSSQENVSNADRLIHRNIAFDGDDGGDDDEDEEDGAASPMDINSPPASPSTISLRFGEHTTVADLKYFAERGCIVALLQALNTPRLIVLGTRMLADYAKLSQRRVAVARNRKILEFLQVVMRDTSFEENLGREYAVETIRSLTATEESDTYLMGTQGLLSTLALLARGGPFVETSASPSGIRCTVSLASEKVRLHACIAIMNLSCGKANKIEIAKSPDVLEAMRDVMVHGSEEARLKATTCIKNLSNADANDSALLGVHGMLEALAHVAAISCENGATPCTTNACLALMNLSISKSNKNRVFRTLGVMDALMRVLSRTPSSSEARIKACSALSNLAIGYDNKIPMFEYPNFVECILHVILTDTGEARTKACSILWSFAAEMKNQVPVVLRGDVVPVLVQVAAEDGTTEARFKCVAALTLLAESLENALPLLQSGALVPLMEILHEAGPDPTQWKGQTASWCVGFLMNIAQADAAVPELRESGVVELLAPLLTLDHYQSLKAAMAVTFCCRFDKTDECYDLLRKTENVIPKIISLLHNTLAGRGGNGYKYGVFTLRSSVGCINALASGPDFMKERIATAPVFESLLRVVTDFCVDGGTPGAIVGGGRDDARSAELAVRAIHSLTAHLIPTIGSSALPFGRSMEDRLLLALDCYEKSNAFHPEVSAESRNMAADAKARIWGGRKASRRFGDACHFVQDNSDDLDMGECTSSIMSSHCCGFDGLGLGEDFLRALTLPSLNRATPSPAIVLTPSIVEKDDSTDDEGQSSRPVRTFLLADTKTGRRFVVPTDPTGGRTFNDTRAWCFRRGRFCTEGEVPDPNYVWTMDLQRAYEAALFHQQESSNNNSSMPEPTNRPYGI
jgi:hypothetical protein